MVEGNNSISNWPEKALQGLEAVITDAHEAGKYLFIWDKQGSVGTFMNYKGQRFELGPDILKKAMGNQTNEGIGENVRKQFVNAMRQGERLCLDIDKSIAKWAEYNKEGTFDADVFFNYA